MIGTMAKSVLVMGIAGMLMITTAWAKDLGGATIPATSGVTNAFVPPPARLLATMAVDRKGDTATYSVMLNNLGGGEVKDIFLAANVASGTIFLDAGPNASKEGFQGVQGGTPVWLATGVPAWGHIGPFTYRVKLSGDTAAAVWAWVHWKSPTEGAGLSSPIQVLPSVTLSRLTSGPVGTLGKGPLVWQADVVALPAQFHGPPAPTNNSRVFYQSEGTSHITQEGITTAYGPGGAGFIKGDGSPRINANLTDKTARRWVFQVVPPSDPLASGRNATLFRSDEMTGLKDVPYTMVLNEVDLQPGASVPTRYLSGPSLAYVMEGNLTVNHEQGSAAYGPGGFFEEQAGQPISLVNTGTTVTKVLAAVLYPDGEPRVTFPAGVALPDSWRR